MWQLHGRLQSHPFSPRGRSRSLSPQLYLTLLFPSDRSAPPVQEAYETLGTFIFKQTPCSIQILFCCTTLSAAWHRMFGILLTSNFNMHASLCLRQLHAFVCSYRWGTDSWLLCTCMCCAAQEAFVAKSWVSRTVRSVDGLNAQVGCPSMYLHFCVWLLMCNRNRGGEEADCWQDFCLVFKSSNMLRVMCKCVFLSEQ